MSLPADQRDLEPLWSPWRRHRDDAGTPRQALKERDEELARGRETSRRLMNQVKPLRG